MTVTAFLRFGEKKFVVKIPTSDDWSNQHQNLQNWPEIYTDGSKLNGRIGAGIHSTCLAINRAIRLPDHCSISKRKYALSMQLMKLSDVCISSDS